MLLELQQKFGAGTAAVFFISPTAPSTIPVAVSGIVNVAFTISVAVLIQCCS